MTSEETIFLKEFDELVEIEKWLATLSVKVRNIYLNEKLDLNQIAAKVAEHPRHVLRILNGFAYSESLDFLARLIWAMGYKLEVSIVKSESNL